MVRLYTMVDMIMKSFTTISVNYIISTNGNPSTLVLWLIPILGFTWAWLPYLTELWNDIKGWKK
jgi:hypothetical protein